MTVTEPCRTQLTHSRSSPQLCVARFGVFMPCAMQPMAETCSRLSTGHGWMAIALDTDAVAAVHQDRVEAIPASAQPVAACWWHGGGRAPGRAGGRGRGARHHVEARAIRARVPGLGEDLGSWISESEGFRVDRTRPGLILLSLFLFLFCLFIHFGFCAQCNARSTREPLPCAACVLARWVRTESEELKVPL